MVQRGSITVQELQIAELRIISYVQQRAFSPAYGMLQKSEGSYKALKKLKQSSELRSLPKVDPRMDKDSLLRVGGRLEFAPVPADSKHPVIFTILPPLDKIDNPSPSSNCWSFRSSAYLDFSSKEILDFKGRSSNTKRTRSLHALP